MALEKVSDILKDGDAHGYGVAAFNVFNYETIAWPIQVAEEERIPIIIEFYPGLEEFIPMGTVAAIARDLASKVSVPIGLHLDHSISFEQAISGIRFGFPSIMIDGSSLDFEKNVELTRQVVRAAHAMGVEVEAELGHVGLGENLDAITNPNHFTDPIAAAEFIQRTGADALAISIGNGHGAYISTPNLDFERLERINNTIKTPLVLHGGSDIPDPQIQRAVQSGINKINIATEYNRAFYNSIRMLANSNEAKEYMYGCLGKTEKEVKNFIRKKISLLNPNGYRA